MKYIIKLTVCFALCICLTVFCVASPLGEQYDAKSVILIEAESGNVLYEDNADERLSPASVTKIMTLLLICESVQDGRVKLEDNIPVSEYAASMGGSQVFLKPGEKITADEMIKSITVASANDCAVAMAEYICGSEQAFVERMNEKAAALGMKNTVFENVTGLDDSTKNHLTTARSKAK